MKKFFKTSLFIALLAMSINSYGEGKEETPEIQSRDNLHFKNPFKSCLPEKKVEPAPIVATSEIPKATPSAKAGKPTDQAATPTSPKTAIQAPEFKIAGLIWNSDRPQAIINDKVLGIGDTIEDSKIVNITKTGVEVIYKKVRFTVPMEQSQKNN